MEVKNKFGTVYEIKPGANLADANLKEVDLTDTNLTNANLAWANLTGTNLTNANLTGANLTGAKLTNANLAWANLAGANLAGADLRGANLKDANLAGTNLADANLAGANVTNAVLTDANLAGANLTGTQGLVKQMGVEVGNFYWKRFEEGLINNGHQFKVGINILREGEVFADEERELCSYPGFHFDSRSRCAANYPNRPLEAKIRIPEGAKINEPWATNGKASADMIEIIQVFDVKTGEDVTEKYKQGGSYDMQTTQ